MTYTILVTALLALPQMVWWIFAALVLAFLGTRVIARLSILWFTESRNKNREVSRYSHLEEVQRIFVQIDISPYCRREAWGLLRSLAIQLIAFKNNYSEATSSKILAFSGKEIFGNSDDDKNPLINESAIMDSNPMAARNIIDHALKAFDDYAKCKR